MGRVIKRGGPEPDEGDISPDTGFSDERPGRRKIVSKDEFQAKSEAQSIRAQASEEADSLRGAAQGEAQKIIDQAHEEAESIREQAHTEGLATGREEMASQLSEMVAHSSKRLQQIEEQAEPQLKELAISIARKILGKELEFHPDAVVEIVKQALAEKARQRREIYLRINPEDLAFIRERKEELLEVLSRCKEIGIREDPDVQRSGVIIETDAGTIDAQLETQLAVFERVLRETD